MARRTRGRTVAGSIFPRRLHAARADRRHRVPEQGRRLRLLFRIAIEALTTMAADPKHLGARIGVMAILHTWGSALTHHPHVHVIVPGGGLSLDGSRWIACTPGFFLPVAARPGCSAACSSNASPPAQGRRASASSAISPRSPIARLRRTARAVASPRLPSRWGCRHPHPSQTRTCRFPASGSSRESFARCGVSVEDPDWRQWVPGQQFVEVGP